MLKNSRYKSARPFEPVGSTQTFSGLRAREINVVEGVIEHQVQENDRLDHLAQHYYNDSRLWWRIVDANPDLLFADHMLSKEWVGRAIVIPSGR
ncbi:hypothetical protein [Vibrio sp. EA2]|uniref:hypothetical protein n=1 Tax=Vibrio sp. EA2 TaxID=3079860 RepID=UPI00294AF3F9|nr:hypothetical protein [Vibrio sp. EA2]